MAEVNAEYFTFSDAIQQLTAEVKSFKSNDVSHTNALTFFMFAKIYLQTPFAPGLTGLSLVVDEACFGFHINAI